jgi:aminoglycoside phosphotransferase
MGTHAPLVLPADDVLGGLGALLDAAAVGERVREAGSDVEGGFLFYLKYKPRTSCVAAYEFRRAGSSERVVYHGKCLAPAPFLLASAKASRHRWSAPASGPPVLPWPEANALLFAFPNDGRLDGLRILAKPRKLRRLASAHLPQLRAEGLRTSLIRYKPERRAVFRSGNGHEAEDAVPGAGEFYWRVYGNGEGPAVFRRMAILASALAGREARTPRPYAYDPERQILAMAALSGRPLDECLETERAVATVASAAEALARLHGVPGHDLEPRPLEDLLGAASATREMLSCLSEEAGAQAGRILETLRRTAPDPSVAVGFVHGDFHPGQVLVGREGVGLLDFDRAYLGSPCADVGAFLAHLHVARLDRRLRDEAPLSRAFVDAYAARSRRFPHDELRWWTALSLLLLAIQPFRRLDAGWPDEVLRILTAAEERLC